jgi:hypothetical protein
MTSVRSSETSHERCSLSIKSTVTNWRVGETIPLGRDRTLRVVGVVVSNQEEPSVLIVEDVAKEL